MNLLPYIKFGYLNYLRQHRYLREIVVVVIFHIFFWAFLYDSEPDNSIWIVFCVFAILLNLITAPSIFFLEKGNTLYFLLSKPYGRRRLFLSKIILIILIDLFWVFIFALIYELRFLSLDFLLELPVRLFLVGSVLFLTTTLISFSYTYRPHISWLIILLITLGNIVNKGALLPIESWSEVYKILIFLLPPLLELNLFTTSLSFAEINFVFIIWAFIQIIILFMLSYKGMMRKDLL